MQLFQRHSLSLLMLLSICSLADAVYQLVWSDEFDSTTSNVPNVSNWNYDIGGGGWGNNEVQYYTNSRKNSYVQGGYLYIVAIKEKIQSYKYSSARLKTQNLQNFQYGRIEARIRLPLAQGSWPAFWMLGSNFPTVGWPNSGEIDIMEWVYTMGDSVYAPTNGNVARGSAHGPGYSGGSSLHGDIKGNLTGFHVYAVEWTPTELRYYMDGTNFYTVSPNQSVFDHPFFIILNVALGGWGGTIPTTVKFPINMAVDYVRVYQDVQAATTTSATPADSMILTVDSISMTIASKGPSWSAVVTVRVVDQNGLAVSGVVVNGSWSGQVSVGVTELTTNSVGQVEMTSGKVRTSGIIRFCVESMKKDGYNYVYPSAPDCNDIASW